MKRVQPRRFALNRRRKGLVHAIITENNGADGVRIVNEIGDNAIISNNEPYHKAAA